MYFFVHLSYLYVLGGWPGVWVCTRRRYWTNQGLPGPKCCPQHREIQNCEHLYSTLNNMMSKPLLYFNILVLQTSGNCEIFKWYFLAQITRDNLTSKPMYIFQWFTSTTVNFRKLRDSFVITLKNMMSKPAFIFQ